MLRQTVCCCTVAAVVLSLHGCGGSDGGGGNGGGGSSDVTTTNPQITEKDPTTQRQTTTTAAKTTTTTKGYTGPSTTTTTTTSTTTTSTTTTTTTTTWDWSKNYRKADGYKKGQFCGGAYYVDRIKVESPGATDSVKGCAAAVEANPYCARLFYFSVNNLAPSLCRCVKVGKKCKPADKVGDGFTGTIYEIITGTKLNLSPGTEAGQFCRGEYGWDRKAITARLAQDSAQRCAMAVADDFECSDTFYYGASANGFSGSICRCVMIGRHCKIAPRSGDGIENTIYELSAVKSRTPFQMSLNFTEGQFCGNPGPARKAITAGSALKDAVHCAEEVAKDVQCGHVFYFSENQKGGNGLCKCITPGNRCAPADNTEDEFFGTIYELADSAGAFEFQADNRVWWPRYGWAKVYRDGWFVKGHKDGSDGGSGEALDLFGVWAVDGEEMLIDWDRDEYDTETLQTGDGGISFSNENAFLLNGVKPPRWFRKYFMTTPDGPTIPFRPADGFAQGDYCGGREGTDVKTIDQAAAKVSPQDCAQSMYKDILCSKTFYFKDNPKGGDGVCVCLLPFRKCITENDGDYTQQYEVYADGDSFDFKASHKWGGTWSGTVSLTKSGGVKKVVHHHVDSEGTWHVDLNPRKDGEEEFNQNLVITWNLYGDESTHTQDGGRTFDNTMKFQLYGIEPAPWFLSQFPNFQALVV